MVHACCRRTWRGRLLCRGPQLLLPCVLPAEVYPESTVVPYSAFVSVSRAVASERPAEQSGLPGLQAGACRDAAARAAAGCAPPITLQLLLAASLSERKNTGMTGPVLPLVVRAQWPSYPLYTSPPPSPPAPPRPPPPSPPSPPNPSSYVYTEDQLWEALAAGNGTIIIGSHIQVGWQGLQAKSISRKAPLLYLGFGMACGHAARLASGCDTRKPASHASGLSLRHAQA
jgi:hypothetical protein